VARLQGSSRALAIAFAMLFVAYAACQFGLFALLVGRWAHPDARRLRGRDRAWTSGVISAGFLAAAWVLLEWGFWKPFPWSFGQVLGESTVLRQAADVGGVYGLGVFVAFVNAAVAMALVGPDVRLGVRSRPVALAVALLLVVATYGTVRLAAYDADGRLRVAVVQGALPVDPGVPAMGDPGWKVYSDLTHRMREGATNPSGSEGQPDLIVWPENVLQGILSLDRGYRDRVEGFVQEIGTPLLIGAPDLPPRSGGQANAAYLVLPNADAGVPPPAPSLPVYRKVRLVPFGEYVPGARLLPVLGRWKTTGPFVPGRGAAGAVFTVPLDASTGTTLARLAPSICYEATWPGAFNQQVREGAGVLVNLTDDSWFNGTIAPAQHLQAVVLRAVETRRWLVRASNSGVSAIVDPTGRIVASIPWMAAGVLSHRISLETQTTLYVGAGDWPLIGCGLLTLWLLASYGVGAAVRAPEGAALEGCASATRRQDDGSV
jgi:apolipoprotein N-acyltransferase